MLDAIFWFLYDSNADPHHTRQPSVGVQQTQVDTAVAFRIQTHTLPADTMRFSNQNFAFLLFSAVQNTHQILQHLVKGTHTKTAGVLH